MTIAWTGNQGQIGTPAEIYEPGLPVSGGTSGWCYFENTIPGLPGEPTDPPISSYQGAPPPWNPLGSSQIYSLHLESGYLYRVHGEVAWSQQWIDCDFQAKLQLWDDTFGVSFEQLWWSGHNNMAGSDPPYPSSFPTYPGTVPFDVYFTIGAPGSGWTDYGITTRNLVLYYEVAYGDVKEPDYQEGTHNTSMYALLTIDWWTPTGLSRPLVGAAGVGP